MEELATQLVFVAGLSAREREVITEATRTSVNAVLEAKLVRLFVLELNAARVTGSLRGESPTQRWQEFVERASQRSFWDGLSVHYPSLLPRVEKLVQNRCTAARRFAERWAADRGRLGPLCHHDPGELQRLDFGAGDSHHHGSTVALLHGDGWQIVYKPRPLAVDIALRNFISELAEEGPALKVRIPAAVDSGDHGWAEFVTHRYADGEEELRSFYRGIGHCLALMRLLGGCDLHAENVIAHGGMPVLIDCETLFAPRIPSAPSRYGNALDRACELLSHTVLGVGLLPGRGAGLGWRGVDVSAVGMLPGEQPMQMQPGILRAGTDEAAAGLVPVGAPRSQNHPSPEPALAEHWPEVLRGFDELTDALHNLDARRALHPRLRVFEKCGVRVVPRSTETYAEIGRMLWHPVSLHNEDAARRRAFDLLKRMAANFSLAPSDPTVINAEIDDLLDGDIPYFRTAVSDGRLLGPGDTLWLAPCHLMEASLDRWRKADLTPERNIIQTSLVSAYINDGWRPGEVLPAPKMHGGGDLDERRRRQAAQIIARIASDAIYGDDGSIAWIAPALSETGWTVQPLEQDLYNGISGLALLAGAYLHETSAGRATPVDGLEEVHRATLHTLHLAEAERERVLANGVKLRPPAIGGYIGLGSQIWTYLMLARWGLDGGDGLRRACHLAEKIHAAAETDRPNDLLSGTAGGSFRS